MQSQESKARHADALKHPSTEEWMTYLYEEVAPERKEALFRHLANCATCGQKLNQWRANMRALDDWKLPVLRPKTMTWSPAAIFRWAVAVAVVLCVGFAVGRVSSPQSREIAELKATVAQLAARDSQTPVATPNEPARAELLQLLADYSKSNEGHRAEDRRVVGLALREMDLRLDKLRTELETVALNTETGFQQTKEGLTTLASYTVADHGNGTDLKNQETKN